MTINVRRQLTLFLNKQDSESIEKIRLQFNPIQSELINSHVTLCREDEIEDLEQVIINLHCLTNTEFTIEFGKVSRFDNGKGVLLPARADNIEFQELRKHILQGINNNPGRHEAHITLMHPRNSICTDNLFEDIEKINLPAKLNFKKISLIEQKDGGQWNVLQEFSLKNRI